jgi:hypothetical protein
MTLCELFVRGAQAGGVPPLRCTLLVYVHDRSISARPCSPHPSSIISTPQSNSTLIVARAAAVVFRPPCTKRIGGTWQMLAWSARCSEQYTRRVACVAPSTALPPTSPPRRTRPSRCLTTPSAPPRCLLHTCSAHLQRVPGSPPTATTIYTQAPRPTRTRTPPQLPAVPASFRPSSDLGAKKSKHGNNAMRRNESQNCDPAPATVQAGLRNSCALLGGAAAARAFGHLATSPAAMRHSSSSCAVNLQL